MMMTTIVRVSACRYETADGRVVMEQHGYRWRVIVDGVETARDLSFTCALNRLCAASERLCLPLAVGKSQRHGSGSPSAGRWSARPII